MKVTFNMLIESGNAAVVEDPGLAIRIALIEVGTAIHRGLDEAPIKDANGNTIGEWSLHIETEEEEDG